MKCQAKTRKGRQCTNDAVEGINYCHIASHKVQGFIKKKSNLIWLKAITLFVKKIFTSLWTSIVVISVILAFYIFYPKVSVSPAPSLNSQNVFQTPFVISNDGNTLLKNVEYSNAIYNIQLASGGQVVGDSDGLSRIVDRANVVPVLESGEKYTVIFPSEIKFGTVNSADMAIVVRFKLPFWPFKIWERLFRFTTAKDVNGILIWYPQPRNK